MTFFDPQNPGIGGIDELTPAEEIFIMNLSGLNYQTGDILYYNGTSLTNLGIGSTGDVLTVAAGLPSWAISSGGGGTPGGSNRNVQVNDSGVFYGDDNFNFIKETGRVGVQILNPLASIHTGATVGDSITPPTSLTLGRTLDVNVDSPTTASATQINSPTAPNTPTVNLIQIDFINGGSTAENTGYSGYTSTGQTIDYRIYAFRSNGSNSVVNPNYYSVSYTDPYDDGHGFAVDLSGMSTSLGNADGYIIQKQIDGGGFTYAIQMGISATYTDNGFTSTDGFLVSTYAENGGAWNANISQYKTIGGAPYRTAYVNGSSTDANQSQYLLLYINGYGSLSNDGFFMQTHAGYYYDLGAGTAYYDWGQSSGSVSDIGSFSSISYSEFNTAITSANTISADPIAAGGSFTADGASWGVEVWDYKNNPINSQKYYVSSPGTASYGTDDGLGGGIYFTGTLVAGDGNGAIVKLLKNGGIVASTDIGLATTWNISAPSSDTSTSASLSSYTGLTWNWSAYGYITSPGTKFSSTPKTYTNSDNNPSGGFIWLHSWATFGTATNQRVLDTSSWHSPGSFYDGPNTASAYELNTGLGTSTVTPNTIGFLGDGKTYYYDIYSYSSTLGIYSTTADSASITLPNDSNHYIINASFTNSTGATSYKGRRKIGTGSYAYNGGLFTPFDDSLAISWSDSSTLTPTFYLREAARFDTARTALSSKHQVNIIGLGSSGSRYTGIAFGFANDSTYDPSFTSYINVDSSAGDFLFSGGDILQSTSLGGNIINRIGHQSVFNYRQSGSAYTQWLDGSGHNIAKMDAQDGTAYFGDLTYNYNPVSTISMKPYSSNLGWLIYTNPSVSENTVVARISNSSNTPLWEVDGKGHMSIGVSRSTDNDSSRFFINSSNTTYTQLRLRLSANLPTTDVIGGFEFSDANVPYTSTGALYFTDKGAVRRRVLTSLPSFSGGEFWYTDGYGSPTILNTPITFTGGIITFSSSATPLFLNGLSVAANKDVSMGLGARYIGGFRTLFASGSTSTSLNITNHSPIFVFTGSTAAQTLTLPTAASVSGVLFEISNEASVPVTVATTSSQNIILDTGTQTSLVLQPGERIKFIATASSTWDVFNYYRRGSSIIVTVGSINAKTVANTNLYTVPTGKTLVVTGFNTRCTAATSITVGPTVGLGNASGTNNIAASTSLAALLTTADLFMWPITGMSKTVTAGNSVFLNIPTGSTGTSQTIAVDLFGYLT